MMERIIADRQTIYNRVEFICLLHVERKEDNKITVSVDMQVDFLAK